MQRLGGCNLTERNFGVVILCPDCDPGGLRYTSNSVRASFPGVSSVAVVGDGADDDVVRDLTKYAPVRRGGVTITSLIDEGVRGTDRDWCYIVMSGSWLRYSIFKKYRYFATSERDILYPVVDGKIPFDEASINGIMLSKKAYEDVGEFGNATDNLFEAKLLWAMDAIAKGYVFKALVGARLT